MLLEINLVEAAAEIAEDRVKEIFLENNPELNEEEVEKLIYEEDQHGMTYTDKAQQEFEIVYDKIFDILLKCKE